MAGVEDERRHVVFDYLPVDDADRVDEAMVALASLETDRLLAPQSVASVLELDEGRDLQSSLQPRGYRLLSRIPRLPEAEIIATVARYGSLHKIMSATIDDLSTVDGIEPPTARLIKDGLARIAESSILDRYS
jgi:diadenylate cyclase